MPVHARILSSCNKVGMLKFKYLRKICCGLRPFRSRHYCKGAIKVDEGLINKYNSDISAGGVIPVFRRAALFESKIAVVDELGQYSYAGLYYAASSFAQIISTRLCGATQEPIAYLCGNDASHIIVQWAIWISGNIAVPLSSSHPPPMLSYFVEDSGSPLIVASDEHAHLIRPIAEQLKRNLIVLSRAEQIQAQLNDINENGKAFGPFDGHSAEFYSTSSAMLIYTSGTTNKPKGAVWTHKAWEMQILALQQAWKYSPKDVVLLTLPLHHVHGQLNVVNATLAAGAKLSMLGSFNTHKVWSKLLAINTSDDDKITMFHAVPTIYSKLLDEYDKIFTTSRQKEYVKQSLRTKVRLMCSGSAPLPVPLFHKWEEISGHRLLERYGMTEVGMALTNVYEPEEGRTPGTVGLPFPGISVRVVDPLTTRKSPQSLLTLSVPQPNRNIDPSSLNITKVNNLFAETAKKPESYDVIVVKGKNIVDINGVKGDLLVKGPSIFTKYWHRPEQTKSEFTEDGWFITGDTVSYENGKLSILGRTSIDIIKTGGYKVSALQIETGLLANPRLSDVAVLGLEDRDWGERIVAIVVCKDGGNIELQELRDEASKQLAPYELPSVLYIVDSLPRNLMGKVDKKKLKIDIATMQPKLKSAKKNK